MTTFNLKKIDFFFSSQNAFKIVMDNVKESYSKEKRVVQFYDAVWSQYNHMVNIS